MKFPGHHPFAVEAHFDKSLVLGFAVPREQLETLIPDCLELDLFEERWGFLAAAVVKTRELRPKGWPKIFGKNFILAGYRVFVRYTGADGRRRRGLYILGSETNRRSMVTLGNVFTQYRYSHTEITWEGGLEDGVYKEVVTSANGLEIVASRYQQSDIRKIELPDQSPFADWKQARRFAGPMPFTFSVDSQRRQVVIVEGVRTSWQPVPMSVERCNVPFFLQPDLGINFCEATLANAFLVEDVPYFWRKGRSEPLDTGNES